MRSQCIEAISDRFLQSLPEISRYETRERIKPINEQKWKNKKVNSKVVENKSTTIAKKVIPQFALKKSPRIFVCSIANVLAINLK